MRFPIFSRSINCARLDFNVRLLDQQSRRAPATSETMTQQNAPRLRVMYIHGLESGTAGGKVSRLRANSRFVVFCPTMPRPRNVYQSFEIVVDGIREFRPEVIVGSSYGAILLLLAMQMGIWRGRSVLVATAMHLVAPHRMYIPDSLKSKTMVVHGLRDALCPIEPVRRMARQCRALIEVDDAHGLSTLAAQSGHNNVAQLVERLVFETDDENGEHDLDALGTFTDIDDSTSKLTIMRHLTGFLASSFALYPFRWCFQR